MESLSISTEYFSPKTEFLYIFTVCRQIISKKSMEKCHRKAAPAFLKPFFINQAMTVLNIQPGTWTAIINEIASVKGFSTRHPSFTRFNISEKNFFTTALPASAAD